MNAADQESKTPKWTDIARDPDFQASDWQTKQRVRGEFYRRAIEPNTPASLRADVQSQFFSRTEQDVFGERAQAESPSEPETPGLFSNALRNAGERGLDLTGNALQFVGNMADKGEQRITEALGGINPGVIGGSTDEMRSRGYEPDIELGGYGLDFTMRAKPEDTSTGLIDSGQAIEDISLGYQPNYTIDRALDEPSLKTIAGAATEQGLAALADMAGLVISLPAYLAARTQEIGEARVTNDGREGMPEGSDYAVSGPTAAASVLLDRFALGRLLPGGKNAVTSARQIPGAVGRASVTEGITEAIQEGGIEYAGESVGTEAGWDPVTAGRRAAGGVIVGAPTGGAVRGGTAAMELRSNSQQDGGQPEPSEAPVEQLAPIQEDAVTPEAEIANVEAVGTAAELIAKPRFELSSAEREVRDSISYGDAFKALRSAAEARGDTEAVNELDAVSGEISAALEAETMARTRNDSEAFTPIREQLQVASERFAHVMERLNTPEASAETSPTATSEEGSTRWEEAWREQAAEDGITDYDPNANLPDTTIDVEGRPAEVAGEVQTEAHLAQQSDTTHETSTEAEASLNAINASPDLETRQETSLDQPAASELSPGMPVTHNGAPQIVADVITHPTAGRRLVSFQDAPNNYVFEDDVTTAVTPEDSSIPTNAEAVADIERAAAETNVEPTLAQAEAGNYRKGKIQLNGLDIAIENPKGSTRRGTDPDGRPWESSMAHHYGDIKGTRAADGDNLDVFVGDNPGSQRAFIIDQVNADGTYDEAKIMLGFDSLEQARQGYLANYDEGWNGLGDINELSVDDLKTWAREGATDKPYGEIQAQAVPEGSQQKSEAALEASPEPAPTLKVDGKPFQTRRAVELSKRFRDTPNAQPVEVEGGWGFLAPTEAEATTPQLPRSPVATQGQDTSISPPESQVQAPAERAEAERLFSQQGYSLNPEPRTPNAAPIRSEIEASIRDMPEMAGTRVVQSAAELPPSALMGMALRGVNPADVRGMFVGDELYVVADNVDSVEDGIRTAVHEAVGHKGVRGVLGDELDTVMRQVYNSLPLDPRGREAFNEVLESYPFLDRSNPEHQVMIAEEMVAHLTEKGWQPNVLRRAVAKIRELLRRRFPNMKWTDADVMQLAERSREFLRKRQSEAEGSDQSDIAFSLRSEADSAVGKYSNADSTNFAMPDESLTDAAIRKMADKMRPLKILEDAIRRSGRKVEEEADTYLAEELFHGKAEYDLRQLREQYVEPLAEGLASAKISQADLDKYLYARHAPERNATIAERNPDKPDMQDGGSGMTNARAVEIIDKVANSGKQAEYDRLAKIVYDMTRLRRDAIREGGLEDDTVVDAWEAAWQHYVPLKGNAADEPGRPKTGRGFEVSGRESRTAAGRKSIADSPSSQVIVDANESLIRRRKNEVAQSLLSLVTDHPNPSLWEVFTDKSPDTQRTPVTVTDPDTGKNRIEVQERPVSMANNNNYFKVKRAGRTYYLKIHDERLMNAMRNVGPESNGLLTRMASTATRAMSAMMTSYNPEFMLTNFTRDVQTALLNLSAEQTRDDGKIKGESVVSQTARDIGPAMKAAWRGAQNKPSKNDSGREWDTWYKEFQEDGAKTGYFDTKDISSQAKEIQSMVRRADGTTLSHMLKARKKTADFVENMNSAVENAVRLSAYTNARRAGISRKQAASLAKNMTVNFNRRGEVGTKLNAAYMFANASIQGTMNFARTMVTIKDTPDSKSQMNVWARANMAQKLAFGMATGAFALGMLNRWVSEEDEDGVLFYDKVPDHVKERNIVIMSSLWGGEPDDYISIPLPYGYNVFSVFGTHAEAVASGAMEPAEAGKNLGLAILGSFSPIGWEDSDSATGLLMKNLTPTLVRSFAQVGFNEDFAGRMIYREDLPFGTPTPASSRAMPSTPEPYKAFASFLNDIFGGSKYQTGGVDISPDVMQHLVNYYGGGAWGFVEKSSSFAARVATGEEVERYRIPFAGRFASSTSPYRDQGLFYERRDELGQIANEADALKGRERIDFRRDNIEQIRLFNRAKNIEKQLQEDRKRRDRIQETETLSEEAKKNRIEMIERQMKRRVDDFNRRYNELGGTS